MVFPFFLMSDKQTVGITGFFVINFVLAAITIFIYIVAQLISAKVVRGKGSFNACAISVLYATAFWPLVYLPVIATLDRHKLYKGILSNTHPALSFSDVGTLSIDYGLWLIIGLFVVMRIASMMKVVHNVGRYRAFFICILTMPLAMTVDNVVTGSMTDTLFGIDF